MKKETILFNLVVSVGIFFAFHYGEFINDCLLDCSMFKIALMSFGFETFFLFAGMYLLADLNNKPITYKRLFVNKYSKNWWMNVFNVFNLFAMLVFKFRKQLLKISPF